MFIVWKQQAIEANVNLDTEIKVRHEKDHFIHLLYTSGGCLLLWTKFAIEHVRYP